MAIPPLMIGGALLFVGGVAVDVPAKWWFLGGFGLCFFIAWLLSVYATRGRNSGFAFEMEVASRGWQLDSFEYGLANNRFGRGRLDAVAEIASDHGYERVGQAVVANGKLVTTFARHAGPPGHRTADLPPRREQRRRRRR